MVKTLINKFRTRYRLALFLILLLSIAAFFSMFFTIKSNSESAKIINVSGRQRMLSQRIAKYCLLIYQGRELDKQDESIEELKKSYDLMKESHDYLTETLNSKDSNIDKEIHDLYFEGLDSLDKQLDIFLERVYVFINDTQHAANLDYILKASEGPLLNSLDKAVKLFERRNNIIQRRLLQLEIIILSSTILVLLLEFFFIFKPTEKSLFQFFKKQEEDKQQIEDKSDKIKKLIFSLSHTFMEPARIIQCYIDLLKQDGDTLDKDKKKLYLETIENQTKAIKARLEDIGAQVEED